MLLALEPDVVCLQEVLPASRARWRDLLADAGLHAISPPPSAGRRLEVMIAAREPPAPLPPVPDLPWPERHLRARIGRVEVHCLHAPMSQREDRVKARTLEAVGAALLAGSGPRVLAGDLNTPRREEEDGSLLTFAQTRSGRLRPERGARHDAAERLLLRGLPGWRDAFRAVHGAARRDRSWVAVWGESYRLDHVLCSPEVAVRGCDYLHPWREAGLSDHSGMWAELEVP